MESHLLQGGWKLLPLLGAAERLGATGGGRWRKREEYFGEFSGEKVVTGKKPFGQKNSADGKALEGKRGKFCREM